MVQEKFRSFVGRCGISVETMPRILKISLDLLLKFEPESFILPILPQNEMKEALLKLKSFKNSTVLLPGFFLLTASVLTIFNFFIPQPPKSVIAGIAITKPSTPKKTPSPTGSFSPKNTHIVATPSVPSQVITVTPAVLQTTASAENTDSNPVSSGNTLSAQTAPDAVSQSENAADAAPTPTITQKEDHTFVPPSTPAPTQDPNKNNAVISNSVDSNTTHVNQTGFATGGTIEVGNTIVAVGHVKPGN